MSLLIQLFLAHILGDFFLQGNAWVRDKEQKKWGSPYLYLHTALHFILMVLITGIFNRGEGSRGFFYFLLPAAIIALLHGLTDGLKLSFQNERNRRRWFFADQALHLLVLGAAVLLRSTPVDLSWLTDRKVLVLTTAILFLLQPTSLLIKTVISKWPPDFITEDAAAVDERDNRTSLENAGALIGILERMLIMLFVLLGRWEGIGFLLAAKSVFRFGDLKEARNMKLTEYVLIGTLLSFGIAIITGVLATRLM
jgi:hypothetical protein